MDDKIITFPGHDERTWREVASVFSEELTKAGLDQEAIDWILDDFKPRYLKMTVVQGKISVRMPSQCFDAVESAVTQTQKLTQQVIFQGLVQMITLEIELYNAIHGA